MPAFKITNNAPRLLKFQRAITLAPDESTIIRDAALIAALEGDRVFASLVQVGQVLIEAVPEVSAAPAPAPAALPEEPARAPRARKAKSPPADVPSVDG